MLWKRVLLGSTLQLLLQVILPANVTIHNWQNG